ncbi:MAG: hypothetical protein ACKVZH_09650 [Blastocatellia bacterium]
MMETGGQPCLKTAGSVVRKRLRDAARSAARCNLLCQQITTIGAQAALVYAVAFSSAGKQIVAD